MNDLPLLTTSERRAFKRCPARWYWEYRQGLRASEAAPALWFGIGIHEALAHYYGNLGYKRNLDFVEVWNTFCDEDEMSKVIRTRPFDDAEEQWVDAKALGAQMLRGHHERWGGDPTWDVIAIERPFQISIPDPRDKTGEGDLALFTSTWDGVKRDRDTGRVGLMEHKTAKSISVDHLPMDDQGGVYWALATQILRHEGVLGKRDTIDEITYNFLKKALPDDRPKDADGYATNKPLKAHYVAALTAFAGGELDPRTAKLKVEDLAAMCEQNGLTVLGERSSIQPGALYQRESVQRNSAQRRMQVQNLQRELIAMEPLRDNGVPYKFPTRDCSWDCPFNMMCELHDSGADWEEYRDSMFFTRDAYDRYRKSASEGL